MKDTSRKVRLNPELILDFLGGTAVVKSFCCWQRGRVAGISYSEEKPFLVVGIYFSTIEEIARDAPDEFVAPGCGDPHADYGMIFSLKPTATLVGDRLYVPTELKGEFLEFKKPETTT